MLHYYTVYAKATCEYCAEAVTALKEAGLDFILVLVDNSPDFYADLKKRYDHQTVPMIVKSSKANGDDIGFVGGCDDLLSELKEEGYRQC